MKECNLCGKCCLKYSDGGLTASSEDVEGWEIFRPDIYRYVKGGNIWMDPESGAQLETCPWLRKDPQALVYTCGIYEDRPEDCRFYPVRIDQMVVDDCEMIEVRDLTNVKHAQKTLDALMMDSRPSSSS